MATATDSEEMIAESARNGWTLLTAFLEPAPVVRFLNILRDFRENKREATVMGRIARGFPEALSTMAGLIANGGLKFQEERFDGIEAMPEAFCGLFRGENTGRRVVRVGEA